jgi:hypothetical protein
MLYKTISEVEGFADDLAVLVNDFVDYEHDELAERGGCCGRHYRNMRFLQFET